MLLCSYVVPQAPRPPAEALLMTDGDLNLCLVSVISYVGQKDKTESYLKMKWISLSLNVNYREVNANFRKWSYGPATTLRPRRTQSSSNVSHVFLVKLSLSLVVIKVFVCDFIFLNDN